MPTYLFLALPCEAKPLIASFGLKKQLAISAFEIYQQHDVTLTISGVGKTAMATAVGYTLGLVKPSAPAVLVNIGIAGHQQAPLGSLFLADKITDQESGKSSYPHLYLPPRDYPSLPLLTVNQPQSDYAPATLYDMEASAFYAAASRFTSSELILTLKIISDNQSSSTLQINAAQVSAWISAQIPAISHSLSQVSGLAAQLPQELKPDRVQALCPGIHLTVNEQQQVLQLLQRWQVLTNHAPFPPLSQCRHGREVLQTLKQQLEQLPVYL